jgi:UDP-glucose:(heptosyl)LPS alpha-1,3-glucosyltransferase
VRSIVLGKGDSPRWHRLVEKLGIADCCTLAGPTDRANAFRHAADVLVHPTYYDPCSRSVLEGMMAGLPCVTTRWDGAAELIDNGLNGFVLDDPDDVETLANRVSDLRNAELRSKIGGEAVKVTMRASMARNAREMTKLYEFIASQKRIAISCR